MEYYKVKIKKLLDQLSGKLIGSYNTKKYSNPSEIISLNNQSNLYCESNNTALQKGSIQVAVYKNVFLWPKFSVAADKEIISNTFVNDTISNIHIKNCYLKKYPVSLVNTEFATSIDRCFSATNYFHILIDTLPRLWSLRHPYFNDKKITLLLPYQRNEDLNTIIKLIIPKNIILKKASKYKRYFCKNYIHLPYLSQPRINTQDLKPSAGHIPNEYLSFLRKLVNDQFNISDKIVPDKNIYINRSDAGTRRIINEKDLLDALRPYNFENHRLSDKSIKQQIEIFRSAKCIICVHGAALTNLLWVNPSQCTLIEIFPATSKSLGFYSKHAKTLKLNYKKIEMNYSSRNSDIVVDINSILKYIE